MGREAECWAYGDVCLWEQDAESAGAQDVDQEASSEVLRAVVEEESGRTIVEVGEGDEKERSARVSWRRGSVRVD